MTIAAWRVVSRKYAEPPYNPFDGEGASRAGGRWNSQGVPVVYTAAARSLAILETLVHADGVLSTLRACVIYHVGIPEEHVLTVDPAELPTDWDRPTAPARLKAVGDAWVAGLGSPVLRVPSAVVHGEDNFVLNPRHPRFSDLVIGPIEPLPIDPRLLGQK